jgi:ABC-type proline/glycine betaine transport system permease subunit
MQKLRQKKIFLSGSILLIVIVIILGAMDRKNVELPEEQLPITEVFNNMIEWATIAFDGFFSWLTTVLNGLNSIIKDLLAFFPIYRIQFGFFPLFIPTLVLVIGIATWFLTANISVSIVSPIILWLILYIGLWDDSLSTLSLTIAATGISLFLGIPLGIMMSKWNWLERLMKPALDFMQTMPPFVYLIPAVMFFGLGAAPGIIATIIYAVPPPIRLTNMGIREIPKDLIEAGNAFGLNSFQLLVKVELPNAMPSIMMGINQAIMMSLAMVIITALIGAGGLGERIVWGITRMRVGEGLVAGLAVVGIAVILDRTTQNLRKNSKEGR